MKNLKDILFEGLFDDDSLNKISNQISDPFTLISELIKGKEFDLEQVEKIVFVLSKTYNKNDFYISGKLTETIESPIKDKRDYTTHFNHDDTSKYIIKINHNFISLGGKRTGSIILIHPLSESKLYVNKLSFIGSGNKIMDEDLFYEHTTGSLYKIGVDGRILNDATIGMFFIDKELFDNIKNLFKEIE
jgi:hypothetical protein